MTITQLRYFVKTAELRSITRTAAFFSVTQPAISNAIHDLEKEYDVQLFIREGRNLKLTEQGQQFLETSRSLVEHYDHAERNLLHSSERKTTCRIALTSNYSFLYLTDLYVYLTERLPSIQFESENVLVSAMIRELHNDSLDIACLSVAKELLNGLYVHEAIDYSLDFCISKELFNKSEKTVSLQEIREFPLAIHQKGSAHNKNIRRYFEEEGITPNIRFELNQIGTIQQLVRRGYAGTILSGDVFKNIPEVHSYSIENPLFTFPVFIVHKKDSSMIRETVRHIREFFREQ